MLVEVDATLTRHQNPHFPALPQSNVHLDILMGRDTTLDVGDFFGGQLNSPLFCFVDKSEPSYIVDDIGPQFVDIHGDMEKARKIR